jgi:hypothetical protein
MNRIRLYVTVDIDSNDEPNLAVLEDMARQLADGLQESDAYPHLMDAVNEGNAVYFIDFGAEQLATGNSDPMIPDVPRITDLARHLQRYDSNTAVFLDDDSAEQAGYEPDTYLSLSVALGEMEAQYGSHPIENLADTYERGTGQ